MPAGARPPDVLGRLLRGDEMALDAVIGMLVGVLIVYADKWVPTLFESWRYRPGSA